MAPERAPPNRRSERFVPARAPGRCRQLRQIGDRKTMFDEAYVPADMFPDLAEDQPYDLFLSAKRAGVFLGAGRERIMIHQIRAAGADD